MPKRIFDSQIQAYWRWRKQGLSISQAAERARFSESYGKGLERRAKGDNRAGNAVTDAFITERSPVPLDELSPIALDCLTDFGRFRARYLGSMSVPWQEEQAQQIRSLYFSDDDEYGLVNCPQGVGKTRFYAHDVPAWLTTIDRTLRGIQGSGGKKVSGALTGNLRDTFARTGPMRASDLLKRRGLAIDAEATLVSDYGTYRPIAEEGALWQREQFSVAQHGAMPTADKEPTWAAFSYEAKFLSWRITLGIWDDLQHSRMLRNAEQLEVMYRWWDDEAESRLDPGGLMLVVMQRLGANDLSRYLLDKGAITDEIEGGEDEYVPRQYHHFIYKAHYDEICQGQHGRDAPAYLQGGCLLDPRRVTWQKIRAKQIAGNYQVVYQQEDTDPGQVLVPRVWIEGGTLDGVDHQGCWDDERALLEIPKIGPGSFAIRYMTVDPSPTMFWGILDWLYVLPPDTEPLAGFRYLLNIERAKMQANEFLEWDRTQDSYVGLAEDWVSNARLAGFPISYMIMERNAAQRWVMQYEFFVNWAQTRGVQVIQHETMANKADPDFGVQQVIPEQYRHARVRLPGAPGSRLAVWPLVGEVTTYPHGATDDLVMSQWFGEFNLQHLVHQRRRMANINRDMPGWARKLEVIGGRR